MDVDLKLRSIAMVLILFTTPLVTGTPDTVVSTVLCNSGSYTAGDPFTTSLAYVVDELESTTPKIKDLDFFNISPYPNAFAYGHGFCSKNLTHSDCSVCLGAAKSAMLESCRGRIGGRAVLQDCQIRYEQYPFNDY